MIIDGHVHVGTWNEPSFSGRSTDLADCARVMLESGVSGALLMPTDQADNEGLLRAIAAHGDAQPAFRLNAWVAPDSPDNLAWIAENAAGIAALKIHPSMLRRKPTDPAFEPWIELAKAHGWPVLIHCGRWQEMAGWPLSIQVARAHPAVNFVLCHMGGDSTDLVEGVVAALCEDGAPTNVYLGTESIRQYWIVARAADRLGPERLIFGSDYNLNHPRSFIAIVDALGLTPEGTAQVFAGTLQRLLPQAHRFKAPPTT